MSGKPYRMDPLAIDKMFQYEISIDTSQYAFGSCLPNKTKLIVSGVWECVYSLSVQSMRERGAEYTHTTNASSDFGFGIRNFINRLFFCHTKASS